MPRETLRKLSESVERLLVAGAHIASTDEGLSRDAVALDKLLEKLGAKAPPALTKLKDQIGKTTTAKTKLQPAELLTLATMTAQVRAAQAQLHAAASIGPLTAVAEVGTPCNAKDLYALHDALVTTGPGRVEKVREALEREDIADLRLVHAVVQALGDPYGEMAELVAQRVVPSFGRAIIDPVRSRLKFPGRAVDARRIKALIAVEKADALPLVEQAIREGSAEMREAALDSVADHLPGVEAFEPLILEILTTERARGVRRAAIGALRGYASDASLDALLDALDSDHTLDAASRALSASKHPQVVDRLLARLEIDVPISKGKINQNSAAARVRAVLAALSHHRDPRITAAARPLVKQFGPSAANAMLGSATVTELGEIADFLKGTESTLFPPAVAAALRLPPLEAAERLLMPLMAADRVSKTGAARAHAVINGRAAFPDAGPARERWVSGLIEAVGLEPRAGHAVTLLGATLDPRGEPVLCELFEAGGLDPDAQAHTVHALSALGGPRCLEVLLRALERHKRSNRIWVLTHAIERLADVATVNRVREIHASEKSSSYSYTGYLLQRLERKFPGA